MKTRLNLIIIFTAVILVIITSFISILDLSPFREVSLPGWVTLSETSVNHNPLNLVRCMGFSIKGFGWPFTIFYIRIDCTGEKAARINPLALLLNFIIFLTVVAVIVKTNKKRLLKFIVIYHILGAVLLFLYFLYYLYFLRNCPAGNCTSSNWQAIDLLRNNYFYIYLPFWPYSLFQWIAQSYPTLPLLGF